MLTTDRVVAALRALLVLAFLAIGVLQVMSVPGTIDYNADRSSDPFWEYPLLIVMEVMLICVQVVIVATWKLLAIGVFVFATSDDPGLPLMVSIMLLAGAVLGLLMIVMRALLRQATTLRTDMDAVI